MSDDQLTTEDFERESGLADRERAIANLRRSYDHASSRLSERGDKLRLADKLAQARIVVVTAMDLQGYGEIDDEVVKESQETYAALLKEFKAQPSTTVHSS